VLDETRVIISRVVAAGNVAVVGGDVAAAVGAWGIVVGSLCITGAGGVDWGQQGGVGGLLGRRCSCLGSFIEYTMRSEECVCTTSRNGVSGAVEGFRVSFTASCWVPAVVAVVCVLDEALLVVFEVVAARFLVIVGDDVMVVLGVSRGTGDRGMCWGVLRGDNCLSSRC
jgi:hypothetical protein